MSKCLITLKGCVCLFVLVVVVVVFFLSFFLFDAVGKTDVISLVSLNLTQM